jgi:hypothetical protein
MTPLERYEAYKKSKGLSETPATVTRPQSYNIRTGGISQEEQTNIQSIRDRQAADREANKIQQEKFWNLTLSKGTPKQEPIKQMDARERARLATETGIEMGDLTKFANVWSDLGPTPEINLPLANQSPIKQNDVLPPSETSEQILEIPPVNSGRIELNPNVSEPNVSEPDWIKEMHEKAESSTPAKSDNTKYFAIGGIAIAALVLFLILRRRK